MLCIYFVWTGAREISILIVSFIFRYACHLFFYHYICCTLLIFRFGTMKNFFTLFALIVFASGTVVLAEGQEEEYGDSGG